MSFDLHLTFRGLCAFIPSDPIPDSADLPHRVERVRVMLPNAIDGKAASERFSGDLSICSHEPVLIVEGSPPFLLTGHDIRISPTEDSAPSILRNGNHTSGAQLQTTFWRVADIRKVRADFRVDNNLLLSPLSAGVVVADLGLNAADFFGTEIRPFTLRFPTDPPYTGNFAMAVRAEIRIAGGSGSFEITPFGGGTPQLVSFRPAEDGIARATISNLCDETELVEDDDFAMFYLLHSGLKGPFPVPALASAPGEVRAEASRSGIGSCIPAVTAHNTNA